jgi:valyl-tRNA synthetase
MQLDVSIAATQGQGPLLLANQADICRLAFLKSFEIGTADKPKTQSLVAVGPGFKAFIPAEGLVDITKEKQRLAQESTRVAKVLAGIEAKLANPNFADRAPEDVVEETRLQRDNMAGQLASLKASLEAIQ